MAVVRFSARRVPPAEVRTLETFLGATAGRTRLSAPELGRLLTPLAATPELLVPLTTFDARGYARTTLATSRSWEIALIGWLPGQSTPIHDHGHSIGATLVVEGALTETRYEVHGARARETGRRRARRGGLVLEAPGIVHRMANEGRARAISLHLYVPALEDVSEFEEVRRFPWRRAVSLALGVAAVVALVPRLRPG